MINISHKLLLHYIHQQDYNGWDLFDGLNSTLLQNTPLYKFEFIRLAVIQFFKRSPLNLRKLASVPKGYNPKGLGLFASGLLYSGKYEEAENLLVQLKSMRCPGYSGVCWGYNFDWQARAFYVPKGKPNIVTTVFVANSFLDYFEKHGVAEAFNGLDTAISACEFILNHMVLSEDEDTLCFGYIPGEEARVHNANMLGAALLARVYSHTKNRKYYDKSKKSMAYSIKAMKNDYSWPYGELNHHQFVDNFHTGFNLVALKGWMDSTGDMAWENELRDAFRYFLETFWLKKGCPKYYNDTLYPIDIHCSAQGIVTCLKLADYDSRSIPMAHTIAEWAFKNMQDKRGFFYYQKTRWYTNKIPYIRWSQAWMFYALSFLLSKQNPKL
ncbi:hypothetical protein [Desulfoluna spongiiphila]|uniref:Delta-aminolevulinic acid dehydratase n=1 Tax=Desulfoluna spongiiphila TaxID=419481 RepID=A0A1G5IC41_9BACT|nr:hypothetical protein [Desulfoluna spongiiphila]SCY73696.1 hypothetical protein SAMN05216233_11912 [Desulfoluna spongiiphila]